MAFKFQPVEVSGVAGGVRITYKFKSGLVASVIQTPGSYGGTRSLWEVAVFDSAGNLIGRSSINPQGHLSWPEVEELLHRIGRTRRPR